MDGNLARQVASGNIRPTAGSALARLDDLSRLR